MSFWILLAERNNKFLMFLFLQNQQYDLDLLKERAKEILRQADAANKKCIEEQLQEIINDWNQLVTGLETRRGTLQELSKHWEELESKWSNTESKLTATEERGKLVDTIVRSNQHLLDTIKILDVIIINNFEIFVLKFVRNKLIYYHKLLGIDC